MKRRVHIPDRTYPGKNGRDLVITDGNNHHNCHRWQLKAAGLKILNVDFEEPINIFAGQYPTDDSAHVGTSVTLECEDGTHLVLHWFGVALVEHIPRRDGDGVVPGFQWAELHADPINIVGIGSMWLITRYIPNTMFRARVKDGTRREIA